MKNTHIILRKDILIDFLNGSFVNMLKIVWKEQLKLFHLAKKLKIILDPLVLINM